MKGIALIAIMLAAASDGQDEKTVRWMTNYTDALNQTKARSKPLLVVIDNPSEPKLCATNARNKPDKDLAETLGNYELCRLDVTTEHGKQVAEAFDVQQFPFMAIIDKTGAGVLYQKSGKVTADEWNGQLTSYKNGQIPGSHTASTANTYTVSQTTVASKKTSTSRSRRGRTQSACYT